MSALGQEPTCAPQQAMSAILTTAKADFRKRPCLLHPRKRPRAAQTVMSAMGQKRTSVTLFDMIGPRPNVMKTKLPEGTLVGLDRR